MEKPYGYNCLMGVRFLARIPHSLLTPTVNLTPVVSRKQEHTFAMKQGVAKAKESDNMMKYMSASTLKYRLRSQMYQAVLLLQVCGRRSLMHSFCLRFLRLLTMEPLAVVIGSMVSAGQTRLSEQRRSYGQFFGSSEISK